MDEKDKSDKEIIPAENQAPVLIQVNESLGAFVYIVVTTCLMIIFTVILVYYFPHMFDFIQVIITQITSLISFII